TPPDRKEIQDILGGDQEILLAQANKICQGQIPFFGYDWVDLPFYQSQQYQWFSELALLERHQNHPNGSQPIDLKPIWEAARFGWAYILSRAYWISADDRYVNVFWDYFEQFDEHNPPYYGYNWISAQEAAFRLIAWSFSYTLLQNSPQSSPARTARLLKAIAEHAARIPSTFHYSLAQNNNHLLSDAAGLMTASICLPDCPQSKQWWEMGWRWFNWGIQHQIQDDGAYLQHSCNYHRLMLQLALWVNLIIQRRKITFPPATKEKLVKATYWLFSLMEATNGKVPNFGPNDGALIQPLSLSAFDDYRSIIQAAGKAFLGTPLVSAGNWDEMSLWYGNGIIKEKSLGSLDHYSLDLINRNSLSILRRNKSLNWAAIRCTHFHNRPGHADQLHVELWWRGLNIAKDAGTYLYTAPPPWNNALAESFYHNTLTVNHTNQMNKAGRFLWTNWAQGKIVYADRGGDARPMKIVAEHNGYRKWGVLHRRSVISDEDNHWIVRDEILAPSERLTRFSSFIHLRLHWLVEDFPWQVNEENNYWEILFQTNQGQYEIRISTQNPSNTKLCLVRGGIPIYGKLSLGSPYGWYSPTYGKLQPAISIILDKETNLPDSIETIWNFDT
ncbi:MAG: alginate lyase family protein, partial [Anaerolineales bacterium]